MTQQDYDQINNKIARDSGVPVEFVKKFRSALFSQPYSGNLKMYEGYLVEQVKNFEEIIKQWKAGYDRRVKSKNLEKAGKIKFAIEHLKQNNAYRIEALRFIQKATPEMLRIVCQKI